MPAASLNPRSLVRASFVAYRSRGWRTAAVSLLTWAPVAVVQILLAHVLGFSLLRMLLLDVLALAVSLAALTHAATRASSDAAAAIHRSYALPVWAYHDILVALTIATVVAIVPGLGAAYLARQLADIPSNNPMIGSADTVGESLAGTVMLAMLCAYPFLLAPIAAALLPVALAIVQGQRRWWRHVWRTRHTIRPTVAPLVLIILIWVSFISIHVLLLWFIISPRVLDEDRINSMALGLVHLSIGVVLPLASELGRMVHATTE